MWEAGKSARWISRHLQVSKTSVLRWLKRFHDTGDFSFLAAKGRPPSTTQRQDRRLARKAKANRFFSSVSLRAASDFPSSCITLRRKLNKKRLHSRRPLRTPLLSPQHQENRLRWAMSRCLWRNEQWDRIVWTDESRFRLFRRDGRIRVWREEGQRHDPGFNLVDVQAGGGSVHVWGAIWKDGRSNLVILDANVNGAMYEDVIRTHLLPAVADKENWILQQDNAPAHRCRRIQEVFAELHITVLPWPSRSPDLNPI